MTGQTSAANVNKKRGWRGYQGIETKNVESKLDHRTTQIRARGMKRRGRESRESKNGRTETRSRTKKKREKNPPAGLAPSVDKPQHHHHCIHDNDTAPTVLVDLVPLTILNIQSSFVYVRYAPIPPLRQTFSFSLSLVIHP